MATGSPNREFSTEELDAMAAAELPVENPQTSRTASAPVASAPTAPEATGSPELAVGDGTSFSIPEPPRGPAMGPVAKLEAGREYSTEELDLIEQANKPKEFTSDELDQKIVASVYDDPTYIPTRDEYFEAKQLKARLKSEGKLPGLLDNAATGAQGFIQTIADTVNEIKDDTGEFLARAPATLLATARKSWRNTNDVTRWIRQTNAPTPIGRDEQTGEFVFGQSGAGSSDAEVLASQQQAAAGQGRSIRAVTEEDLKDEEFDRFVMERSRQKELEEWVASTTAPTEFVTRLVTGRNQTEQPMQATSELAGGLLEPTNIATMGIPLGAGAKTLGLSRLTKAGGARAARVLERAASKGIEGMETGAAKFQEIIQKGTKISPENQVKMAKWSAAGAGVGGVFSLDSDIPGVSQAQDAAKFIGGAYIGYHAGLGVLRTVQKIAGPTATILRVASDAGEGFDDIAQASVATKLEAFPELSLVREALENPTRFRPIESTPARLAADPRLGKQTRAIADALASPAIVQGVRGASAVATGAVKGAVANAPFVALALNADEDKAAANMFGMGVGFGALGGAAGRFTGLEQRRAESRAFDTARMLMDVELAGGDVTKTIQTYSKQQLGDLAAMQGFFRDKVDFVPLGKADFDSNTQALGGAGAAGLFIQAPPGEKARVFVNLDAKRDGIVPHELGHALLKSGALGSAQADTIRSFTTRRYTQAGVEARGREYATAMIQNENAAKFPGQNFPVTPASISAKMDELGQSGLLRGDMDPLDWARDEIFAEDFRQASQSMDFAGIRRHLPADGSWLGSMENFLGAQANALSISGVRIDPVTGQPDPLFKVNPILATDPVLKKQLDQYLNNYRNWINHPDQTKVRGVRVAPAGRASDLANNPQVTFHDYGNGVMANEFARMDPTTGQAAFREQSDITAETIKRQQQVKTLVGSKLIPDKDPNLGPKKTADGRVTVRGRILPQQFDFLNGFAQHQRGFARQFETAAATGESMQVRYHSIGTGDTGALQIKKLGNLEAITREIIPWGWELSGPNNLLASVLDLTQFRNRAIKAINAGEPTIGRLYNNDIKLIEADLKQWMDNHRQDLPGSNKIGEQRRDAINSLIGIATNINKAANPFSGKIAGPSSAIKQFRLDRVDAAVGTGRQGFHFDYDKANNNLLPEIPTPLPDLSRDLPTGQAMPDAAGPKGKDVFARSLEDIKLSIPANERWIGTKLPGQPVRAADGRRFLEHDLNTKTGAMNVTQAAIDKAWADAIAVTGPAASRAISELQEKGFTMKPPPEAHWKAAENLPNKDRLWYEISSEAMSESFPDFSQNELGKTMDVTAATSPLADPNYNARLAIAILAEDFQKTPSVTPAVVQTSVKDALMGEFGKAEQRKVGSFGGTFRFLTGLSDDPPLTTNDRQVAASMGIPDSAFGTYPVLYELQSRFGNNLRDHVNANGGMNSQFGPFQSHQLQALSWVQQRAEQRLQRRTNITDEEAFNGDAYASAFKLAADDLREAGIDVPRDPITGLPRFTASVLSDPRVQQILTPPGTEFLKSTIQTMEMNTKLREDGKKFADALEESKKLAIPGNIKLAEQVLQRAAKSLTLRTADKADKSIKLPSPLSKLASVFGAANADITRIEFGRGTFQGDVSPNVRIPMDAVPEKYRPAFMAVLGKHFYQAAQAASRFKSVDAAQAQSHSIWMHGKATMDGLEDLAQALTDEGHEANISQRPNGVLIDVHPKFTDQGPMPISPDTLDLIAENILGKGNSSVIPREYQSIYLEKQEYDSTILKATKELLNEHADQLSQATSISLRDAKTYLRGDKALAQSPIPLNRRAEKIRDSYRQRIDQLQSSQKELKSLFKDFEADTREATGEMQKRIDAYHKKASKPSNPSKPTGNNPSAEDLAAFK